jgi:hypothetical protein
MEDHNIENKTVYDSKEKHNSRTHFEKPQGKNPTELEGGL